MNEEEQKYFKGLIGFTFDSDDLKYIEQMVNKRNKIIEEVREYIEHSQNYGKEKIIYINGNDILEILDKVGKDNE